MQKLHRLLLPVATAALLVACSKSGGDKTQQGIIGLPPMSANCEALHERFQKAATPELCDSVTAENIYEVPPMIGAGMLQAVERRQITVGSSKKTFFHYALQFRTRNLSYIVNTVSDADVDYLTNKFYAIDLMNNCRYEQIKDSSAGPRMVKEFKLPNRLACL